MADAATSEQRGHQHVERYRGVTVICSDLDPVFLRDRHRRVFAERREPRSKPNPTLRVCGGQSQQCGGGMPRPGRQAPFVLPRGASFGGEVAIVYDSEITAFEYEAPAAVCMPRP